MGSGVLTTTEISMNMKLKTNVGLDRYTVPCACNAGHAYMTLQAEDMIGSMLPCSVIVSQRPDRTIEVSAVDQGAYRNANNNETPGTIASRVQRKHQKVTGSPREACITFA